MKVEVMRVLPSGNGIIWGKFEELSNYIKFDVLFGMPEEDYQNVDVWIHEFTELSLARVLAEEIEDMFEHSFFWKPEDEYGHIMNLAHALTSLVCISKIGFPHNPLVLELSPDLYWRHLKSGTLKIKGFKKMVNSRVIDIK